METMNAKKLKEWQPRALSNTRLLNLAPPATVEVGPDSLIFRADDVEAGDALTLYRALKASGTTNVIRRHPEWEGCPWYDAIPTIRNVRILAQNGNDTTNVTAVRGSGKVIGHNSRSDSITFEMTVLDADSETRTIRIPGDVAFGETYHGQLAGDLPTVLLTKASKIVIETLEKMIVDGFFRISDDTEDDSSQTQLERFRAEARYVAISVLKSADEARNDSLTGDIEQVLHRRLVDGERIVIDQAEGVLKVDIQSGGAAGGSAAGA